MRRASGSYRHATDDSNPVVAAIDDAAAGGGGPPRAGHEGSPLGGRPSVDHGAVGIMINGGSDAGGAAEHFLSTRSSIGSMDATAAEMAQILRQKRQLARMRWRQAYEVRS